MTKAAVAAVGLSLAQFGIAGSFLLATPAALSFQGLVGLVASRP
jgi:hypothetical protein